MWLTIKSKKQNTHLWKVVWQIKISWTVWCSNMSDLVTGLHSNVLMKYENVCFCKILSLPLTYFIFCLLKNVYNNMIWLGHLYFQPRWPCLIRKISVQEKLHYCLYSCLIKFNPAVGKNLHFAKQLISKLLDNCTIPPVV